MVSFLLQMLTDAVTLPGFLLGTRLIPAAEALEKPSIHPKARPYQIAAFCLFMAAAGLLLSAALADWFLGRNADHDWLGWAGLVALNLCAGCGIRYGYLNRKPKNQTPTQYDPVND